MNSVLVLPLLFLVLALGLDTLLPHSRNGSKESLIGLSGSPISALRQLCVTMKTQPTRRGGLLFLLLGLTILAGPLNEWLVSIWNKNLLGDTLRLWASQFAIQQNHLFSSYPVSWLLVTIGILTPIAEELFFRGALQGYLSYRGWSNYVTVGFPAIVFTLLHFNPLGTLPIFFLALLLGYLRLYSHSLYPSILIHAANNLLFIFLYYHGT